MPNFFTDPQGFFNSPEVMRSMIIWLPSLLIWSFFWKSYALWRAARNCQKGWYVILLFLNTLGILEIIYLGLFQKDKNPKAAAAVKKTFLASRRQSK